MKKTLVKHKNKISDENSAIIHPVKFKPADASPVKNTLFLSWRALMLASLLVVFTLVLIFLLASRSLIFETEPLNSTISVSGLTLPLGNSYLALPGRYQYKISATGYQPASGKVEITRNKDVRHAVTLKRLPGHLQIASTPPVAMKVFIDEVEFANEQGLVRAIPPGNKQVTILTERYLPFSKSIEIEGLDNTQTLPVKLLPAWAKVHINSQPVGAKVSLANKPLGSTPLMAELLQGEQLITLTLPKHKTITIPVTVTAGIEQNLGSIVLPPADGMLQLTSYPPAASVTINGEYRGLTPLKLSLSTESEHQLRLFKDGYKAITKDINLKPDEERTLNIKLMANFGKISVISKPSDAKIYINGKFSATGETAFTLPTRRHKISVRKNGYAEFKTTIIPNDKFEQKVHARLLTKEQARWNKVPKNIKHSAGGSMRLMRPNAQFTMGSSRREQGRRANEILRHIFLTKPFYIGVTEVTNQEYRRFKPSHSSSHANGISLDNNNLPAVNISWNDAALFCNWLSVRDGLTEVYRKEREIIVGFNANADGYRLVTEAEWAWAARYEDGNMKKFPWGNLLPVAKNSGNYADKSAERIVPAILRDYNDHYAATAPVASFSPNNTGIFDLGGNVSEWIHDLYTIGTGLSKKREENPVGPQKGDYHVIRGSSWRNSGLTELRLSYRDYGAEGRNDTGFRLARWVNLNKYGEEQ